MKSILFFISMLFACAAFAEKPVFVFVSADASSPEHVPGDYHGRLERMRELSFDVAQANEQLPPNFRPRVVHLQLENLHQLPDALTANVAPEEKIKMIMFSGHGNEQTLHLHAKQAYSGEFIAGAIAVPRTKGLFSKDFAVFFDGCSCGQGKDANNFQIQFMETFRKLNATVDTNLQTRSMLSFGHVYSTTTAPKRLKSTWTSRLLYKLGVISAVANIDTTILRTMGATTAHSSIKLVGAVTAALTTLYVFVGADAIDPQFKYFLPLIALPVSLGYARLQKISFNLVRQLEYLRENIQGHFRSEVLFSSQVINKSVDLTMCHKLF